MWNNKDKSSWNDSYSNLNTYISQKTEWVLHLSEGGHGGEHRCSTSVDVSTLTVSLFQVCPHILKKRTCICRCPEPNTRYKNFCTTRFPYTYIWTCSSPALTPLRSLSLSEKYLLYGPMNPGICWATKDTPDPSFKLREMKDTFGRLFEFEQPSSRPCDIISYKCAFEASSPWIWKRPMWW